MNGARFARDAPAPTASSMPALPCPLGDLSELPAVNEWALEPACVSTCPAKAMRWDSKANIMAYLNDPANGFKINGSQNWIGNGAMFWASKKVMLVPPKADPLIEDHVVPSATYAVWQRLIVPTLVSAVWQPSKRKAGSRPKPPGVLGEV
jgi:hypothetical protein